MILEETTPSKSEDFDSFWCNGYPVSRWLIFEKTTPSKSEDFECFWCNRSTRKTARRPVIVYQEVCLLLELASSCSSNDEHCRPHPHVVLCGIHAFACTLMLCYSAYTCPPAPSRCAVWQTRLRLQFLSYNRTIRQSGIFPQMLFWERFEITFYEPRLQEQTCK